MTRSDIIVILMVYGVCLLFLKMTLDLKQAAQIYPLCLIAGLAILNTLYLFKQGLKAMQLKKEHRQALVNDLPDIFNGFQWRQFFFTAVFCIAYIALLGWFGFYLSSLIYLAGVMAWLRVKPVQLCCTVFFLSLLVYGVFTVFLKVPLPKGILFS